MTTTLTAAVKGDCYYYWISPAGLKVLDEIDG